MKYENKRFWIMLSSLFFAFILVDYSFKWVRNTLENRRINSQIEQINIGMSGAVAAKIMKKEAVPTPDSDQIRVWYANHQSLIESLFFQQEPPEGRCIEIKSGRVVSIGSIMTFN